MRALLIFMLIPLPAFAASPNEIVFSHECKAINPEKTGIHCGIGNGVMQLRWVKRPTDNAAARSETAKYEYSRIVMRYFDLGGRHFEVRGDRWPAGRMRQCWIRHTRSVYCTNFQCRTDGTQCEEVKGKHQ